MKSRQIRQFQITVNLFDYLVKIIYQLKKDYRIIKKLIHEAYKK